MKKGSKVTNGKNGSKGLTKGELVTEIAKQSGLTKADSERALNAFVGTVTKTLKKGTNVNLIGFGSFSVQKRKARMGRNPQTGEDMKIPSSEVPKFKAGKNLKDSIK